MYSDALRVSPSSFLYHEAGRVPRKKICRKTFADKCDSLTNNLESFYLYNSAVRSGLLHVSVPGYLDGIAFQIGDNEWTENVWVNNPKTVTRLAVVPFGKRISGTPMSKRMNKAEFARLYYVLGNKQSVLLLDNGEWLQREKVWKAFVKLKALQGIPIADKREDDVVLQYVCTSHGCFLAWVLEYDDGKYLVCLVLSGGILDSSEVTFSLLDVCHRSNGRLINLDIVHLVVHDVCTLEYY